MNIFRRIIGGRYLPSHHDYIRSLAQRTSWPPCLLCGECCPSQREHCQINEAFLLCSGCDPWLVEFEDRDAAWEQRAYLAADRMPDEADDENKVELFYIDEEYFR